MPKAEMNQYTEEGGAMEAISWDISGHWRQEHSYILGIMLEIITVLWFI